MKKTTSPRHVKTMKPSSLMPVFATLEEGSEYAYYEAISKNVNPSSVMVSTEEGAVTGELFEDSLGETSDQSNIALRVYPVSSPGADFTQRSVSPEEAAEIVDETLENSSPPAPATVPEVATGGDETSSNSDEGVEQKYPFVPARTGSILRDAVEKQKFDDAVTAAAEAALEIDETVVAQATSDLNPAASDEITPEEAIEQLAIAEDSEPIEEPTVLNDVEFRDTSLVTESVDPASAIAPDPSLVPSKDEYEEETSVEEKAADLAALEDIVSDIEADASAEAEAEDVAMTEDEILDLTTEMILDGDIDAFDDGGASIDKY